MPLSPGYAAIVKCKLPQQAMRTTVLTAKRWTPTQAQSAGIVDRIFGQSAGELVEECVSFASELAGSSNRVRKRNVYSMLKREIYSECYEALTSWWMLPRMVATLVHMQILGRYVPKRRMKAKTTGHPRSKL